MSTNLLEKIQSNGMDNPTACQKMECDKPSDSASSTSDSVPEGRDISTENKETASPKIKEEQLEHMLLSCRRTEPKGDINLFEEMFQSWKNQEKQAEIHEKALKQELEICERDKDTAKRKITDLEKTVDLLQKAIKSLHNDLELTDKLGKENEQLKESVQEFEKKIVKERKESEEKCMAFEKQIREDKIRYQNMIQELQDEMQSKLNEKDKILQDNLKEKELEFDKMNKEKESEKQTLIVEFENKLVKLQRQKATASMSQQQNSSANQEIFRKKLQHLRKEHEQETNSLKEQIRNLQEQLNASQVAQQCGTQNKSSGSVHPLFKKARRF